MREKDRARLVTQAVLGKKFVSDERRMVFVMRWLAEAGYFNYFGNPWPFSPWKEFNWKVLDGFFDVVDIRSAKKFVLSEAERLAIPKDDENRHEWKNGGWLVLWKEGSAAQTIKALARSMRKRTLISGD